MSAVVRPIRGLALVLAGTVLTDVAGRAAQVAVPLVVLASTGSASLTGLAAGSSGLPVVLSPWWASRLRHRMVGGRSLATVYLLESLSLAVVPLAAGVHALSAWPLLLSGLSLGFTSSLSDPGRSALLADLGDAFGEDRALLALVLRDVSQRVAMVAGPALGGLAVAADHGVGLLWAEAGAVVLAALLAAYVPGSRSIGASTARSTPGIWATVRTRPEVLVGWVVRGVGCATWFAFSLGLALLSMQSGQGAALLASGMSGYGAGALLGASVTVPLLRRLPVLPTISGAWAATGCIWVLIATTPRPIPVAICGAASGVAVALGNGGVTAQIARSSEGSDRRILLSGQSVLVSATGSAGLLAGGPILAHAGAAHTMTAAGLLLAALVLAVPGPLLRRLRSSAHSALTCGHHDLPPESPTTALMSDQP
jgi:predicted MFS family arabinose efflux permease